MNQIDLTGRVAVITGAARGIGLAIARRFRESGARADLWDADPEALERVLAANRSLSGRVVDVADLASVERAAAGVLDRHERVDILVNNAGIVGPDAALVDYEPAAWLRILEVDLVGVYHCCRALVPGMRERGYGRVVNIASLAGKEGTPNMSAYSAAKAGVIALTKSLGKELAGSGVLVNALAPAAIETELLAQMSPAHVEVMVNKSPLGRLGTVEEVAAITAWLASEECSFNTGATFDLSGGRATY